MEQRGDSNISFSILGCYRILGAAGRLRRRTQTRDVELDLSPNRGLKVIFSLAWFLPQPVVGLKHAPG